jgi:ParB-like chromosome segregation protein Spo0J
MATAPTFARDAATIRLLRTDRLRANPFSLALYGDPEAETDGLLESVSEQGILVPLVVVREGSAWEVVSGHRRLACARALGLRAVPCELRCIPRGAARQRAVLEYNRQRRKSFSQSMREAEALNRLLATKADTRRRANLRRGDCDAGPDRRNSDDRAGRTDTTVARVLGLGGKDLYRQARAIWHTAQEGDARAQSAVAQLDAGTKTVHAAYKDLRRRDRFTSGFRPTPYDVWAFRHDRAFGIPHPGSIPPDIVAHTLHYYSAPGALVVDPMAGGGTTLDVCASMGRSCLAYDIHPVRPEIRLNDLWDGLPEEAIGCDLLFCDPPYHTMLAHRYGAPGAGDRPLADWLAFLQHLAGVGFHVLKPGGYLALLLACQTEKDLPAGVGYIDHAFHGYNALVAAGFAPERRIHCPMDGAYLPQHVQRARIDGRMLGQVRDLIVVRKPRTVNAPVSGSNTLESEQKPSSAAGHSSGSPPASS